MSTSDPDYQRLQYTYSFFSKHNWQDKTLKACCLFPWFFNTNDFNKIV